MKLLFENKILNKESLVSNYGSYVSSLADKADKFPHNLKVFNLCLIKKPGVENWAKFKAKESFDKYFKEKLE
ncbi:MAG: hypothetical protein KAS71_11005 [Bacteroidales bacterium]|nr:hypothetical protein [Bacteroidales bacterium]